MFGIKTKDFTDCIPLVKFLQDQENMAAFLAMSDFPRLLIVWNIRAKPSCTARGLVAQPPSASAAATIATARAPARKTPASSRQTGSSAVTGGETMRKTCGAVTGDIGNWCWRKRMSGGSECGKAASLCHLQKIVHVTPE